MKILSFKSKKPVSIPGQDKISDILDNIKNKKSYYTGGTLCVDDVIPNDVLLLNLNGNVSLISAGISGILTFDNRKKLFNIYKEIKGETEYYKSKLKDFNK